MIPYKFEPDMDLYNFLSQFFEIGNMCLTLPLIGKDNKVEYIKLLPTLSSVHLDYMSTETPLEIITPTRKMSEDHGHSPLLERSMSDLSI